MPGPLHSPEALAAFQNGEQRLVFARFKAAPAGSAPFFLEEGAANDPALKAWVRDHLECLIPDCPAPAMSVVNRANSGRRDGFSHRPGAGKHTPESLFHQQGKAVIQSWVMETYPEATVRLEEATSSRDRIADVMVTWPTGQRVAIEIQYAALTVEAWNARHQSYLDQGITPVWLFGHCGAHMRPGTTHDPASAAGPLTGVHLSLLHQNMAERGANVLWINPINRAIGTPWTFATAAPPTAAMQSAPDASSGARHQVRPDATTETALFTVDLLDQCILSPSDGLITPTNRALDSDEAKRQEAEARRIDELAKAKAAAVAESQRQATAWERSGLHETAVRRWGEFPALLDVPPGNRVDEVVILAHPRHWRAAIYEELIHPHALGPEPSFDDLADHASSMPNRPTGPAFTPFDIAAVLQHHNLAVRPNSTEGYRSLVLAFLQRLKEHGTLAISASGRTPVFTPTGQRLAEAENVYQFAVIRKRQNNAWRAEQEAARREVQEKARAAEAARLQSRLDRHHDALADEQTADTSREQRRRTCPRCGGPLPHWLRGSAHIPVCP